ncbi:MAG: NAD-dependent epimerase/dehydratase family protein [Pseudomonadota bacterium]
MQNNIITEDLHCITSADLPWELFADKTILISGANGFLPAYMLETLLYLNTTKKLNTKVIGLVRNKERALTRFQAYEGRKDLRLIRQDVTQPFSLNEKMDYIIHAASQASPKYYGSDPVGTLTANVLGTYHLLEMAKAHQAENFLFFSSGEVYGELDASKVPTEEHMYGLVDPTNVRSCYAESKRAGENMCVSYAHQYGLSVKIVRPFHTYGPGLKLNDGRVFADFVADVVRQRDIVMLSDGLAVRAFCYLADATLGFFTVLLKGKNATAYNIGNPDCKSSVIDLAIKVANLFPERNIKVIKKDRGEQQGYIASKIAVNCPDISRALALGWRPVVSIEEGFKRTITSFLDEPEVAI